MITVEHIVNGLSLGNIYALVAIGFVLVYGVGGLINFSQGSVLMVGAYVGWTAITIWRMPVYLAVPIVLVVTAGLGVLIEAVILRRLWTAPRTAGLLATIAAGLMIDRLVELVWSPRTQPFFSDLPDWEIRIAEGRIGVLDVVVLGTCVICIGSLILFLRLTKLGWAIRATAQDSYAAVQVGIDTDGIRMISFAIASAVGGLGGLLIGLYYANIFSFMSWQFGMRGFTAAMLGGITSLPGAIVGGLLLGLAETISAEFFGMGARNIVAFLILILVLVQRPQGLFGERFALVSESLEELFFQAKGELVRTTPVVLLIMTLCFALVPLVVPNPYVVQVAANAVVFSIAAIGLNLLSGSAGQISVGHAAIMGIGGYVVGIGATRLGLTTPAIVVLAVVAGGVGGLAMGYPVARLRGGYVALATLAIGQMLYLFFLNAVHITRGPMGIVNIPPPQAFGIRLTNLNNVYWFCVGVFFVTVVTVWRVLESHLGRCFRAVREDEVVASVYGIRPPYYKLVAFTASGAVMAVAGVLQAYLLRFVAPTQFDLRNSVILLAMAILGGFGNVLGAVVGASMLVLLPEVFREFVDLRMVVYGLVLWLVVWLRPQGILGGR